MTGRDDAPDRGSPGRVPDCGSPKCGRGRNAAATRQAILDAARNCFMRHGYEQVGVREIAALAEADPALVNRYFGSKERLFAEAVAAKFDLSAILAGDCATLGERLARYVLEKKKADGDYDPLVALLRSTGSESPARMLREALVEGFAKPLAARLDGPDALVRAELVGSVLLGLLVHRTVIGVEVARDQATLVSWVGPMLQALIDGRSHPNRHPEGTRPTAAGEGLFPSLIAKGEGQGVRANGG
jgi:AcrR family transcriptional regulator